MTEPVFLIDADLIALGRALKALYLLAGNGRLTGFGTIGDAVVEVLPPRRRRGESERTIASS